MKKKEILLFDDERWTLRFINAAGIQRSVNWRDTAKCTIAYLLKGKGSWSKRLISVLKRAFTCSLKPQQTFPPV